MSEPIHIISLGAGVQSSTMALMAAHGEITPMPKCAIFADTQDEPQSVYKWLDWLEKQLPFPVVRATAGSLSREILNLRNRKAGGLSQRCSVPGYTISGVDGGLGIAPRQCTSQFKVDVLLKNARRIGNIKRGQKHVGIIQWIGISLDEVHRMKPSKVRWTEHRFPLVDAMIRRRDCLEWMKNHNFPVPPRSACVYCPYHSDNEWRRLKKEAPADFAKAVQFEKDYNDVRSKCHAYRGGKIFLHPSRIPLDQVDFRTDEDHGQQTMFGNDCTGLCGV